MEIYFSEYFELPLHRIVNYFAFLADAKLVLAALVLLMVLVVVHKAL